MPWKILFLLLVLIGDTELPTKINRVVLTSVEVIRVIDSINVKQIELLSGENRLNADECFSETLEELFLIDELLVGACKGNLELLSELCNNPSINCHQFYTKLKEKAQQQEALEKKTREPKTCTQCDDNKKNIPLALTVFGSIFAIGAIYIIYQRYF